jgi:hypothetical protein
MIYQTANSREEEDGGIAKWQYLAIAIKVRRLAFLTISADSAVDRDGNMVGGTTCGNICRMGRCHLKDNSCDQYPSD